MVYYENHDRSIFFFFFAVQPQTNIPINYVVWDNALPPAGVILLQRILQSLVGDTGCYLSPLLIQTCYLDIWIHYYSTMVFCSSLRNQCCVQRDSPRGVHGRLHI